MKNYIRLTKKWLKFYDEKRIRLPCCRA
jgi:hypothetical protein